MAGRRVVAVAGTHGKTTTTSLLTVALQAAGADPTYAIGGDLTATGVNAGRGSGDLFVAEADESDGAFLVYRAVRRHRHQRRGRPPRPLGDRGGVRARRSTTSPPASPRRVPGLLRRRPGRGGAAAPAASAGGRACVTVVDPAGRRRRRAATCAGRGDALVARATTTSPTRSPRWPRGASWASPSTTCARDRVVHRDPAPDGAQGRGRRRPGLRQLRPPPDRDRGRPRGGARRWPGTGGWSWRSSPTSSRAPACSAPRWARRSARPTRWWSATSTWPARSPTPRSPARWSPTPYPCPPSTCVRARPRRRAAALVARARPGDLVLTLGAGDVTEVGRASSRCWGVPMASLRRERADGRGRGPTVDATPAQPPRFARRQWRRRWLGWRTSLARRRWSSRSSAAGSTAVWFSPWLAVEAVEVSGARTVDGRRHPRRAVIDEGEPLARVDLAAAERAGRVAGRRQERRR